MPPCLIATVLLVSLIGGAEALPPKNVDWPRVANDAGCMRYSQLDQINRENVRQLKPVWTYHTRRARRPHRQDDRVYSDCDRRRDVHHHRLSSRGGP